jgi:hypothetical protein
MELKAVYHATVPSRAGDQPTLIYNLRDGFTWLKDVTDNDWSCFSSTAVGAEINAREAGFDPQAIVYIDISG